MPYTSIYLGTYNNLNGKFQILYVLYIHTGYLIYTIQYIHMYIYMHISIRMNVCAFEYIEFYVDKVGCGVDAF